MLLGLSIPIPLIKTGNLKVITPTKKCEAYDYSDIIGRRCSQPFRLNDYFCSIRIERKEELKFLANATIRNIHHIYK